MKRRSFLQFFGIFGLFDKMFGISLFNGDPSEKMTYEKAFELCEAYGESKHLNLKERLKVKTKERFRFDFNSTDLS